MTGLDPTTMSVGGVVVAVLVLFILWKIVKVALKIALFFAVVVALAVGVGAYLKMGPGVALPVPSQAR